MENVAETTVAEDEQHNKICLSEILVGFLHCVCVCGGVAMFYILIIRPLVAAESIDDLQERNYDGRFDRQIEILQEPINQAKDLFKVLVVVFWLALMIIYVALRRARGAQGVDSD